MFVAVYYLAILVGVEEMSKRVEYEYLGDVLFSMVFKNAWYTAC